MDYTFPGFGRHYIFSLILGSTAEIEFHHSQRIRGGSEHWGRFMLTAQQRQKVLGMKHQVPFRISRWPVLSHPGPSFQSFLVFSLLSSPWSLYEVLLVLCAHTKNMCFYLPSGLHNFSEWYFFSFFKADSSQRVFSESFDSKWTGRQDEIKELFPKVFMLETKRKRKWHKNLCEEHFLFPFKQKKENYQHTCHFTYFSLVNFIDIFVYIHLVNCDMFQML